MAHYQLNTVQLLFYMFKVPFKFSFTHQKTASLNPCKYVYCILFLKIYLQSQLICFIRNVHCLHSFSSWCYYLKPVNNWCNVKLFAGKQTKQSSTHLLVLHSNSSGQKHSIPLIYDE